MSRKIIYIAGFKPTYPRNSSALKMLREHFDVTEITSSASAYWQRFPIVALKFIFARKNVDAIYVGYMGQPLVLLIRLFTQKPIVFDVFISLYDSICLERKAFSPQSFLGRIIFWFDKMSCKLSTTVIIDTETHRRWFSETFSIPLEKIHSFYICADAELFKPAKKREQNTNKFVVEFHGGFIPLQGVEYIIHAAKLLEHDKDIVFQFLGRGLNLSAMQELARSLNLTNIHFNDKFVPLEEVPQFIQNSDIALGIFGIVEKTRKVIPNKLYEAIACRKPVITSSSPAIAEAFTDQKDVLECEAGNPRALADSILKLKKDTALRERISEGGYETFKKVCDYSTRKDILTRIVENTIP